MLTGPFPGARLCRRSSDIDTISPPLTHESRRCVPLSAQNQ
jgi:hypothetical protein